MILRAIRGNAIAGPPKRSAIVYVSSRNDAEKMTQSLLGNLPAGSTVGCYHASMSDYERNKTHVDFLTGSVKVVVATIAFGMGIDKPDIRTVIHAGAPQTMEAYLQQIGRAGRDGLESDCLILFSNADFSNVCWCGYNGPGCSGQPGPS